MNDKKFTIQNSNTIKGIAIIFMIFHHLFWKKAFTDGYSLSFFPFTSGRMAQICTFFKICVSLFTFVSGFGLLYAYKKLKTKENFFKIRFLKLIPTFVIVSIFSFILYFIFSRDTINSLFFGKSFYAGVFYIIFDLVGLSTILKTPTICAEWWYIGASLIFAFLVPIIYKLAKKYSWFTVGIGLVLIPRIIVLTNLSTLTAFPYIFSLFLGMYCEDKNLLPKIVNFKISSNKILNKLVKLTIYITLLLVSYLYFSHLSFSVFMELSFGIIPFLVILFVYEFIVPIKSLSNILSFVGANSAIMYMIHAVFLKLFKPIIYGVPHFLISFIILFLMSFVFSLVLNFILNIIGFNNYFNKIINNMKKS